MWFTIPLGPEGLWVGRDLDPHVFVRDGLDAPTRIDRDRVTIRVAEIADSIRGHIVVRAAGERDPHHGEGDFEVSLCDPAAAATLRRSPPPPVGPLAGTLLGKPFRLGRAFIGVGGSGGFVLGDDEAATSSQRTR